MRLSTLKEDTVSMFWLPSPMIYLYRRALKEVHEFLADHVVVRDSDKLSYKKLLLDQTNNGLQMALTHQFFNSHLKNRLKMISQKRSGRPTLVMYALGIPVLLLLMFAFTYAIQPKDPAEAGTFYETIKKDLAFDYVKYANETDQTKMPYIQINGEDINYPLSDLIEIYEKIGSVCSYLPKYAEEMYGKRAKLGYINIQDPTFKKQLWNPKIANEVYEKLQARVDTVPVVPGSKTIDKSEIFKVVQQMPRFPGCEDSDDSSDEKEDCAKHKMLEYIYSNLRYPKVDREKGIEGMSVVQFVINQEGDIKDVNVVRSISKTIDLEVARIVEGMNNLSQNWTPGMQRGKAVNVLYTLPVRFKLQGDEKEDKNLIVETYSAEGVTISDNGKHFKVSGKDVDISSDYGGEISAPTVFVDGKMWFDKLSDVDIEKMKTFTYTHPRPTWMKSGRKTAPVFNFTSKDASDQVTVVGFHEKSNSKSPAFTFDGDDVGKVAYIVDGEIVEQEVARSINPDDIETINVMKADHILLESNFEDYQAVVDIKTKSTIIEEAKEVAKSYTTVSGKVTDEHGKPLIGANVIVNGESTGTITNLQGEYEITCLTNSILEFSYVGHESFSSRIESNSTLDAALKFTKEKKVDAKKEKKSIVIRTTDSTKVEPLFVIDGKVKEAFSKTEINPDDIATINVLKGESAEEKYGKKAINGVVEIVTKNAVKKSQSVKNFDTPAYFPGCSNEKDPAKKKACSQQNLLNFIYSNVKYPEKAREKGVHGMVVTKFIISEDGKIRDIKILRSVVELNVAALAAVSKMADTKVWEPATKDGKAVAMEFTLPIKFKISDEAKQVEPKISACDDLEDADEKAKCREEKKKLTKEAMDHIGVELRDGEQLDLDMFLVYPNPTNDVVNISFEAEAAPIKINLLSIDGKLIKDFSSADFNGTFREDISLKGLASGNILLRIEQAGKVAIQTIVVE